MPSLPFRLNTSSHLIEYDTKINNNYNYNDFDLKPSNIVPLHGITNPLCIA